MNNKNMLKQMNHKMNNVNGSSYDLFKGFAFIKLQTPIIKNKNIVVMRVFPLYILEILCIRNGIQ